MNHAPDANFWAGRRVLVTGHTGFKGAWLTHWLKRLGAQVLGVSLPLPVSTPSLWEELSPEVVDLRADISDGEWEHCARDFRPQTVFHLAAQSMVPRGYVAPVETFTSNVLGTVRLMDALARFDDLECALVVTTDKVYEASQARPFSETDHVGGSDPYSASKACAELVVRSWPTTKPVATARAGNVIGGGDWASDRLIPDMMRAWGEGHSLVLRHPEAVRPWQHVLDPLRGYLLYAEGLASGSIRASALNFGPGPNQHATVVALVEHAAQTWAGQTMRRPGWTVRPRPDISETGLLELDSSAAGSLLGWRNLLDWWEAVDWTLRWHARRAESEPVSVLVNEDLDAYMDRLGK